MKLFMFLKVINRFLLFIEKTVLCALLFSMVFLSFGQIVLREIFKLNYMWISPLLQVEVLWVTFIGAALATEYKQHIKIDFLANIVESDALKKNVITWAQVFAFAICFILFFVSADYISAVSGDQISTIINGIPDWQLRLIIPYAFLVMTMRCTINIQKVVSGEDDFNPPGEDFSGGQPQTGESATDQA